MNSIVLHRITHCYNHPSSCCTHYAVINYHAFISAYILHILVIKIYELEYSVSRHSVLTVHLTWYCTCHTSVLAELLQRYVAQIKPTMHWSLKSYRISFIYCYRCFEFRWYYPDYLTGFGISIYLSVSAVFSTYIRYLHSTTEISNVMRV